MRYRLTPHAAARIAERAIPAEWLESALDQPEKVLAAANGREERQRVFERAGRPMLLRVICDGDLVITALLTSKLGKYGVPS